MKIKLVQFMAGDGSAVAPRQLPGIGRVSSIAVGDIAKDTVDGEAIISSLDYEPRSGAIVIRKTKKDDNPVDASRSWNRSPREGGNSLGLPEPHADWCAISIGSARIIGDDAVEAKAVKPGPEQRTESIPPLGDFAKTDPLLVSNGQAEGKAQPGELAMQGGDPPRSQPVVKQQVQNQRR